MACLGGTFLVVAKLASFEVGRYIYMLYPPCCLLGVRLAGAALGRSRAIGGLFAVLLLISSFGMYNHKNLTNTDIYPLLEKIEAEAIRPNPGIACVMIESQKDWVPIMVNAELLRDIPRSYILPYADLQALPQVLREYQAGHDKLLVYAGNYVGAWQSPPGTELTKEEFLKGITELTPYKHWHTISLRPSGLGSDYELYLFSKEALSR